MKNKLQSKKEISLLLFSFLLIGMLGISTQYQEYFNVNEMSNTTADMFDHPLKVSNAALSIKVDIYKMHIHIQEIVLLGSKEGTTKLIKEINEHEQRVNENLNVIDENILGERGLALVEKTKLLFEDWKPIRD